MQNHGNPDEYIPEGSDTYYDEGQEYYNDPHTDPYQKPKPSQKKSSGLQFLGI